MQQFIDTEIRILHDKARNKNFCKKNGEKVLDKTIYSHKKINLSLKQASLKSILKVLKKNKVNKAIISGLPWGKEINLRNNNSYLLTCIKKHPKKLRAFYNIDFSNYKLFKYSMNLIDSTNDPKVLGYEFHHTSFLNYDLYIKKKVYFIKLIKKIISKKKYIRFTGRHPHQHRVNLNFAYIEILNEFNYSKFFITSFAGGLTNYINLRNLRKIFSKVAINTSASKSLEFTYKIGSILPKNLFFGSDYPFNHFNQYQDFLKAFTKLRLTKKLENIVKYKNAQKKFFS